MKKINKQITIVVGILVKDNKVLLTQRNEKSCPEAHLKWELPGGKIDFGETMEEALAREFKEETGITVSVDTILPFTQTVYWKYSWGTQQTLCLFYKCNYIKEQKIKKDHHIKDVKWFKKDEVASLDTLPGVKESIQLVFQNFHDN